MIKTVALGVVAWTMDFLEECVQKPRFSSFSKLTPLFYETYGHPSRSFIHQTKPQTLYFKYLKYEPDLSTYAIEKWVSKLSGTAGHPVFQENVPQLLILGHLETTTKPDGPPCMYCVN